MGFPAVKIFCYFLFRQPYPRSFYPFHNSGNDFPVVVLMRLLSLFYPKTAVFLIKPCTDSFFLPLLQMPELLICPQQLPVYLFMIFCPDFFFPLSYYKVVVFIDPLQGLYAISIITILYLFYRYGYDI